MTLIILWMVCLGLFGMWLVILGAIGEKGRFFLARHPFLFLSLHLPIMFAFTMIGGEGLMFGVGNLLAGLAAQVVLAVWAMRKHGLTFTGKPGPQYERLHPRAPRKPSMIVRTQYRFVSALNRAGR